mmetsp:Transcript_17731/g.46144  ORF Transcript_17731/g.46144 Transcript_17731/m.46144 type:complete len:395 (-) Transcript_17731:338-1522(-)
MCCCGCGLCACGETKPSLSRVFYFLWFCFSSALSWALRDYGAPALNLLPWAADCSGAPDPDACLGTQAVLRVSIANLTFFGVHWLFLLGVRRSSDLRLVLHTSLWPLKLLGWAGLTAAFFAVPSAAVYGYAQAARVLGGAYLVLQLVSLLDFLYRLNGALLDRDGCARGLLVALTAAAYATALTAIGIMYYLFAPRASCSLNIFLITFTLLLGLALTGVSVMPNRMQESGLFTAGAVFLYAAFLCFSALNSEPNSQGVCERAAGTQDAWITICGFLVVLFSAGWSALSSGSDKEAFTFDVASEMRHEEDGGGEEELNFSPSLFHLMFTLASAYLAMLLTAWDWQRAANGEFEADKGVASLWVKIAAQWVCVLLYIWTVIAPVVLPDRDFSSNRV